MKERYSLIIVSYFYEDDDGESRFPDKVILHTADTEKEALKYLKALVEKNEHDEDCLGIEREVFEHICDGVFDWVTDEDYGESGYVKRLYEFKKQDLDLTFGIDGRGDHALFLDQKHILKDGWGLDQEAQDAARGHGVCFFRCLIDGEPHHTHGFIENGRIVQWG